MKKIEKKIKEIEIKIISEQNKREKNLLISEMKKIGIEKLPYSYSSLKQFIDAETMNFHYNKHYKGYVDKLNSALSKKKYGDLDLEKIIKNISRYDKTIRNNAGGAFNHALFWNMLTPEPKKLQGELYKKITKEFGTFNNFKKKFETIAKDRFGSGWVWLVLTSKSRLKIMSTPNQDNPLMNVIEGGGFPLLGLDLWEHAYYLKYKNKRDEYISNFWKVVNWDFVSKLFEMKTQTKLMENLIQKKTINEENENYIQLCDKDESGFFQDLMSDKDISEKYGKGIYSALKKLPWLEYRTKDLATNRMQGFYKNNVRHDLSYLAGNYRAFCMITKSVNKLLENLGRDPIVLMGASREKQLEELNRLVKILNINATKIFDENSPFFKGIMSNLGQSKLKGNKVEELSKRRLQKRFGNDNVEISSGFGYESDNSGFDGQITIGNDNFSMQIKPFDTSFEEEDKIVVMTTGRVKGYEQDFLVFTNAYETLVFSTKNVEESKNSYVFPKDDLIYNLR